MWNIQAPVQAGVFLYDTTQLKTMTQQHPITPPPELVQQWFDIWQGSDDDDVAFADFVAVRASQYGADQELEACCEWLVKQGWFSADEHEAIEELRAARRPKPPSLNSIALQMLGTIEKMDVVIPEITDTIRRALEALPDD